MTNTEVDRTIGSVGSACFVSCVAGFAGFRSTSLSHLPNAAVKLFLAHRADHCVQVVLLVWVVAVRVREIEGAERFEGISSSVVAKHHHVHLLDSLLKRHEGHESAQLPDTPKACWVGAPAEYQHSLA